MDRFLSTFPTINTSDNGVGKLDYHPNDKNSFNGMFFYGHYNAIGRRSRLRLAECHGQHAHPYFVDHLELGLHSQLQCGE